MALPVTVDRIRRIVVAYLDEGAQTSETLAKRATKELGAAVDDETVDLILEQTSNCWEVGIDGYINPQIAFEGVTFTHRITAEEARTGAINALPNFVVALDLAAANIEAELVEKHRNGLLNLSDPSGGTDWLDAIVPVFPKLSPADLALSVGLIDRARYESVQEKMASIADEIVLLSQPLLERAGVNVYDAFRPSGAAGGRGDTS